MTNVMHKVSRWDLGSISVTLNLSPFAPEIEQQTSEHNLLYTLARASVPGAGRCALDLLFHWGHTADTQDALRAYSERPLDDPPAEYIRLFREVDWTCECPGHQLRAIILAGTKKEDEKALLLRILGTLKPDFRDGALFAASSFSETRFVEAVSRIAMSMSEADAFSTAEMWALTACFRRWLERRALSLDDLTALLKSAESADSRLMRATRLINHVLCPGWDRVPYPAERFSEFVPPIWVPHQ